jgi:ribose/xylose/arabinose/galactoside ABC-type transport system permease subunit
MRLRLAALGLLALTLGMASPDFLAANHLLCVLRQACLVFLSAAGFTLVALHGGLDRSIAANLALSGSIAAAAFAGTGSTWLASAAGAACGGSIGLLNAALIAAPRVPPFLVSGGMVWIGQGWAGWFTASRPLAGIPAAPHTASSGPASAVLLPLLLTVLVLGASALIARYTGRRRARRNAGSAVLPARRSGPTLQQRRLSACCAGGLLVALASLASPAANGPAGTDMCTGLMLQAIAAALLGGVSLSGGSGSLPGTFAGALMLSLVFDGLHLLGIGTGGQGLATGALVILAALSDAPACRRSACPPLPHAHDRRHA